MYRIIIGQVTKHIQLRSTLSILELLSERTGAEAARWAHNPKVPGSNATSQVQKKKTRHQGSLLFCRREGQPRRRERKSRRNRKERDTTPPGSWPMEEGGGEKEKPIVALFLQILNTAQRPHNLHATPPTVPDYRRILGCLVGGTAQRGCVARHCRSRAPVP